MMKVFRMILIVAAFTVLAAQSRAQNKYEFDGNRLKVEKPISFVPGTDQLEPASDEALKFVKDYLTDKKYISTLRIESHLRAGTANAQALSEKRALAIAKWLIKNGIDCKRLIAVGFGSTKPVSDPGSMPENTRIEFQNAALAGHAIGGMPLDGGGKSAGDICPSP